MEAFIPGEYTFSGMGLPADFALVYNMYATQDFYEVRCEDNNPLV